MFDEGSALNEEELDSVLQILENPVRRRIIRRLSEEPSYALQLSKELGLGQPLVSKHLSVMERAGMVTAASESSPNGPERRRYSLAKSVSITMDVAPHVFKERAISFGAPSPKRSKGGEEGLVEMALAALSKTDDNERLSKISQVLGEVDSKIASMEEERAGLLALRNELMDAAAKIVVRMRDLDTRKVVFHILEEHDREVESISRSLDMREVVVRSILEELGREIFG